MLTLLYIYLGTFHKSEILKNEPIEFDYKLIEWLPTEIGTGNWSICWRATKDGWAASVFHSNCDGKKPTLTIVQVVKNNKMYVFGGYATDSWEDPRPDVELIREFEICTLSYHFLLPSPFCPT